MLTLNFCWTSWCQHWTSTWNSNLLVFNHIGSKIFRNNSPGQMKLVTYVSNLMERESKNHLNIWSSWIQWDLLYIQGRNLFSISYNYSHYFRHWSFHHNLQSLHIGCGVGNLELHNCRCKLIWNKLYLIVLRGKQNNLL